jgi:ribose 5-phosphate isomerase A
VSLGLLIARERADLDEAAQKAAKAAAARAAVGLVRTGMTLGLGTGSTVAYFLEGLAARVAAEGLQVVGVPTSRATEQMARQYGIPLLPDASYPCLRNDLCVDGADRVDNAGHLIKGGGGALLREKMIASHSDRLCILVDPTKLEPVFGESFPLPVECVPFGIESSMERLAELGCRPRLRMDGGSPRLSDNGGYLVDCTFDSIPDPLDTERRARSIPGVVEVGLFVGMMRTLIVGRPDGSAHLEG